MRLRRQLAMLVEKDGETLLAHWVEYPLAAGTRTHLAVIEYQATLLPRSKVALGCRESRYDLDAEAARAWLVSQGYRIVGELPG